MFVVVDELLPEFGHADWRESNEGRFAAGKLGVDLGSNLLGVGTSGRDLPAA